MIKDIKRGRYSVNGVRKTWTKIETNSPRILKFLLGLLGLKTVFFEGDLYSDK